MAKINKFLVKLPVNKLMWDRLSADALESELPGNYYYSGRFNSAMYSRQWQACGIILAVAEDPRYLRQSNESNGVHKIILEIVHART